MEHERITLGPVRCGAKPCIRGLRITVYDVLSQLAEGVSQAEILEDISELDEQDIRTCLAFAADRERRVSGIRTG